MVYQKFDSNAAVSSRKFYLFEWYTHNPWESMKIPIQFLNIYLFEVLMVLFLFLFGRLKWSLRLQSIFFMLIGLANYYVLSFRSAPIMPWDIYSVKTALSVAGDFKYTLNRQAIFVLIGFVLLIVAESVVNLELKGTDKWKNVSGAFVLQAPFCFLLCCAVLQICFTKKVQLVNMACMTNFLHRLL